MDASLHYITFRVVGFGFNVGLHARRYKSKKKAFTRYAKRYADGGKGVEEELNQLKKNCSVIRVLAHTQITKINYGQKKAHLAEIQVLRRHTSVPRRGVAC